MNYYLVLTYNWCYTSLLTDNTGTGAKDDMDQIKVIKGMEPDEVMRAHRVEGKRVARMSRRRDAEYPFWEEDSAPAWNWVEYDYAIIDDTQPQIDWDGFDWEFFNQYGGVPIECDIAFRTTNAAHGRENNADLRESPFYPWFGGECPVPEDVEVAAILRGSNAPMVKLAGGLKWEHRPHHNDNGEPQLHFGDIIAFRLTGRVL